ncbi:MAG: DUF4124 domain-containing protein [Pseudomonadota bacterium]
MKTRATAYGKLRCGCLGLTLLAVLAPVSGEPVFRYLGPGGETVFSDRPPPQGMPGERVEMVPPPPPDTGQAEALRERTQHMLEVARELEDARAKREKLRREEWEAAIRAAQVAEAAQPPVPSESYVFTRGFFPAGPLHPWWKHPGRFGHHPVRPGHGHHPPQRLRPKAMRPSGGRLTSGAAGRMARPEWFR